MILVTGAGGKTGQAVVDALVAKGANVRAWLRRDMPTNNATETLVGDMTSQSDWTQAMVGIHKVYHICPNMHPDEINIGQLALQAGQEANISHFVYHSVLHPQTQKMPHHWNKLRVEEMLFESGLSFTILQPTAYIQNILPQWKTIQETGLFTMPYPVTTKICLVDLADVAEVAAKVLMEAGHEGATYELVGTAALSQVAVADVLSQLIGRTVTAHETPLEEWQQNARKAGLSDYTIETLSAMFRYYADYGLIGNANCLRYLLSREPNTLQPCFDKQILVESGNG
ncbi:MAG: NmrA family NAD(P)-binding protein [Chloroflexota bacterium]